MASITGIYYGLDEPKLTLMREQAFAQIEILRTGKRFSSVGGRGKSFTKDNMTIAVLRDDLAEIMAALRRINPRLYGKRVRRMVADFSYAGEGLSSGLPPGYVPGSGCTWQIPDPPCP
jgi:hypothetical protein